MPSAESILDPLSTAGHPSAAFALSDVAACGGASALLTRFTWLLLGCISLLWPCGLKTMNPSSHLIHDLYVAKRHFTDVF